MFGAEEPAPQRAAVAPMSLAAVAELPRGLPREELPLFGPPIPDDEPLITKASPPRPPLAVRRATPEVAETARRRRNRARRASIWRSTSPTRRRSPIVLPAERAAAAETWHHDERSTRTPASARACWPSLLDLVILAVIDAVVIYFTMQLCYLTVDDLGMLPKGPLIAFLFVQNGGYLVAFTAGGQTLGKMVAGIRVVQSDSDGSLDLGRAFLRTLMWIVLAVPAGLGFLTALFSRDHRGLHDRFAGTRVVRASV